VSYLTMRLLTLQLFKNSIVDTQEKLRLSLHSLSVLLEYTGVSDAIANFIVWISLFFPAICVLS
jgi:hypothetical protein